MSEEIDKINHNATPSANGWDFQSNAAIVLFIRNIKNAKSVKVEGPKEDIEITLSDGITKIMAQVKSTYVDDTDEINEKNNLTKFKSAIDSLSDANDENTSSLIYIINSRDPLNTDGQFFNISGIGDFSYDDLTSNLKNKINDILLVKKAQFYQDQREIKSNPNNMDLSKLRIMTISFWGGKATKYNDIQQEVGQFLVQLRVGAEYYAKNYREQLQLRFFQNSSDRTTEITKSEFVWTLIVLLCEDCDISENYYNEIDEEEGKLIRESYRSVIDRKTDYFPFANKVIYDYENYPYTGNQNEKIKNFIINNHTRYNNDFSSEYIDEKLLPVLIKIILSKILYKKSNIKKIKEEVNLNDF